VYKLFRGKANLVDVFTHIKNVSRKATKRFMRRVGRGGDRRHIGIHVLKCSS
jgi:hypothetical protein